MSQWREGVDTCVFKPAVKCQGEAVRRSGVSRIRMRASGSRDLYVEGRIRDAFPDLVEREVVSVYSHSCVPEYEGADTNYAVPYSRQSSGCSGLGPIVPGPNPSHINFITPKWKGELHDYLYPGGVEDLDRIEDWREVIRDATYAAVSMVPDAGPWIIHTDCHLGNVLYDTGRTRIYTAIGDWGRTLIIENPTDIASIRDGIRKWIGSIEYLGVTWDAPVADILRAIRRNGGTVSRQQPPLITNALSRLMVDPMPRFDEDMARLRGWCIYTLVKFCIRDLDITSGDDVFDATGGTPDVDHLTTAPNNAELMRRRRALLKLGGAAAVGGRKTRRRRRHITG